MIIGTGVDITEVKRLKQAIDRWGESFLDRVFTDKEIANAKTHVNFFQHLAGRFAAKEAIFKALGRSDLLWKDVQILNDPQGKPYCSILNGKAKNKDIHISISHVKSYAVANAIVAKKS